MTVIELDRDAATGEPRLLQLEHREDGWRVGVISYLLCKTRRATVAALVDEFFARYPTPGSCCEARTGDVAALLAPLGLQNQRAGWITAFSAKVIDGQRPEAAVAPGYVRDSILLVHLNDPAAVGPDGPDDGALRQWWAWRTNGGFRRAVDREWNENAATYDREFSTPLDKREDAATARLIQAARRAHPGRVLDVGCGTGAGVRLGRVPPADYVGIDPSAGMLAVARGRYPDHDFRQCTAEGNVIDGFSLAVCLYATLNYVDRLDRALAGIAAALKPGAGLLATVYLPSRLTRRRQPGARRWVSIYTTAELIDAMHAAGFEPSQRRKLLPDARSDFEAVTARRV